MTTEVSQSADSQAFAHEKHHTITISVEVNGKDKEVKFERSVVTGAEIRSKAGVPPSDDLTRLHHGKPTGGNIGPDESVEIKNDEHFLAAPNGVVS